MPRRPEVLCAGGCGRMCWAHPTCAEPGKQMCRACRYPPRVEPARRLARNAGTICRDPACDKPAQARGMCKTHYNRAYGYSWDSDPARSRARARLKTYRRKAKVQLTDITIDYELSLRAAARRCPICTVKLVEPPYLPASKELDHIVPLGMGGTHTIGNVRITCRSCNQARPKDGSDYAGPVTLWAQDASVLQVRPPRGQCGCGTRKVKSRCPACHPRPQRLVVPPKPKPMVVDCLDCGATLVPTGRRGRPRKRCSACAALVDYTSGDMPRP